MASALRLISPSSTAVMLVPASIASISNNVTAFADSLKFLSIRLMPKSYGAVKTK